MREKIKKMIIALIKNGINDFYFGGLGETDEFCWHIVTELKKIYPHIKRIYCFDDEKYLSASNRPAHLKNEDYEEFIYLPLAFNFWYMRNITAKLK